MVGSESDTIGNSRSGWVPPLPPFSGPAVTATRSAAAHGGERLGLLYIPPVRPTRPDSERTPAHEGDAAGPALEDNVHEEHISRGDNGLVALTDVDYRSGRPAEQALDNEAEGKADVVAATQDGLLEAWTGSLAQLNPGSVEAAGESRRASEQAFSVPGSDDPPEPVPGAILPPSRDEVESAMSTAAEAIGRMAEGMLAAPFMVPSDQPPMVGPEAAELAAAREYRRRETVAEVMEELAQRIREGEIPLSTLQEGAGDAVTLAEVLAAMLRNAR